MTVELLDRAAAAREVATVTALALIQAGGNAEAALGILADMEGLAQPGAGELDCVPIAAQAIRDADALRGDAGGAP